MAAPVAEGTVMVRPPSRAEISQLLKKLRSKGRLHVARILGDSGGGRFPILLEKRYRFSYHEEVSPSDSESRILCRIGVAQRLPDGTWEFDPLLEMEGSAALDQGEFSWNRAVVKDLRGPDLGFNQSSRSASSSNNQIFCEVRLAQLQPMGRPSIERA